MNLIQTAMKWTDDQDHDIDSIYNSWAYHQESMSWYVQKKWNFMRCFVLDTFGDVP